MTSVQRRILEHLAAVGVLLAPGCHEPSNSATPPTLPPGSVIPIATSSASGDSELGQPCKSDTDCSLDCFCWREFNETTGTCTQRPVIVTSNEGRPLLVDGRARVARLEGAATQSSSAWTAYLARAAAEEHASIATFARTICQLMALGAPLHLLARTQQALADEIQHTRGCLEWLRRSGGDGDALGVLPEAVADIPQANRGLDALAHALLIDVIRGGCVGETLAAEGMLQRAARAPDPELAAWLERVADDEARHSALAFATVAWLVAQRPLLTPVVHTELAGLPPSVRARIEPLAGACGLIEPSA